MIVPLSEGHLDDAVALFQASYRRERARSPLLPERALADPGWIYAALQAQLAAPGAALIERGQLVAYMATGRQFAWKGQHATLVPEYAHAAAGPSRRARYQRLYAHLAAGWVADGSQLHIVAHLAHDAELRDTLYQLGFGAILAERLRDLAPLGRPPAAAAVVEVRDPRRLVDLEREHQAYYPRSPIFLRRPVADEAAALAGLSAQLAAGDALLCWGDDEPAAYMAVGASSADGEGFLLRQTGTAQIKAAYTRPSARGRGVGAALLDAAIGWARQRGYTRLLVEHETANPLGSAFWGRHLRPYLTISMRYVDRP